MLVFSETMAFPTVSPSRLYDPPFLRDNCLLPHVLFFSVLASTDQLPSPSFPSQSVIVLIFHFQKQRLMLSLHYRL